MTTFMTYKTIRLVALGTFFLFTISVSIYAKTITGKVISVKDGDSIVLLKKKSQYVIRLVNIDCPELHQAYGTQAKLFTSGLVSGKVVKAEYVTKDKYGRYLAEIFLPDGRSLNRDLVRNGFAWKYDRYTNDISLEALEQQARKYKIGLWKDDNPIPPWEFRKKKK